MITNTCVLHFKLLVAVSNFWGTSGGASGSQDQQHFCLFVQDHQASPAFLA